MCISLLPSTTQAVIDIMKASSAFSLWLFQNNSKEDYNKDIIRSQVVIKNTTKNTKQDIKYPLLRQNTF